MPWPCLKSPGYSRQCLARGGLGLAWAVSLCVCSSAGPRTHLSLPHYRGARHKSRKSSLIVLSWLAIDRQQAINNTRGGGRKAEMLSYSSLNLLKKSWEEQSGSGFYIPAHRQSFLDGFKGHRILSMTAVLWLIVAKYTGPLASLTFLEEIYISRHDQPTSEIINSSGWQLESNNLKRLLHIRS